MANRIEEAWAKLTPINVNEANQMIEEKDHVVIFVGRKSCGYCKKFVPKLAKSMDQSNKLVMWINSESEEDSEAISDFRQKYDVPTVPGLLVSRSQQVAVKCDSSLSVDEIIEFIQ